jgi:hyaluronoglucosaminidase
MAWAIRGVIEGFYGQPWSWDERLGIMAWCHERGMTHYVYAPKDDPLHRQRWREPYPADELDGFERLLAAGTLQVGFAISPGLSIDYRSADDRAALAAKLAQLTALGIRLVCLAFDDIAPRPGLGEEHAELTTWLRDELDDEIELVLVPTEYTGTTSSPYLDALATGVPASVLIAWTGPTVVCDEITEAQARQRAASLGGRAPLLWDNYPVNDALMADRLFLGPLQGRDPLLVESCAGYLANPMVQAAASKLPLSSVAAFLRGEDPLATWEADAQALGIRTFAEACDGAEPWRLARDIVTSGGDARRAAIARLRAWIDGAVDLSAAPEELLAEVSPWLAQLRAERDVVRIALDLLDALDDGERTRATEHGLALLYLWPALRRATHSVLGPRCSARPVLGQWPDGTWRYERGSLVEDRNATDALVRFALGALADAGAQR